MIVDFAFGGSGLLDFNKDVVSELGHHSYKFIFKFGGDVFEFVRTTDQPDFVFLTTEVGDGRALPLTKYCSMLKSMYQVDSSDLSFRSLVGLYARVWGKENLDVRRPLHVAKSQPARECVDNLIKTFNLYGPIRQIADALIGKEKEKAAIRAAFKARLLPKIGKRQHEVNEAKIANIEGEIQEIKDHLAKYAANINQLVDERMLGLKTQRDDLLAARTRAQARLLRARKNLAENKHIQSRNFASLVEYFPQINVDRIVEVEEFHGGVARLLRAELKQEEAQLSAQLSEIESRISVIDAEMSSALSSVAQPGEIVSRVYDLSNEWNKARGENDYFERFESVSGELGGLAASLSDAKNEVLAIVQRAVNLRIEEIVREVFGEGRKSPTLFLDDANYRYEVFEDTGTGTAYLSLVILDIAIFSRTFLPCVVHDSILFKNVENESVAKLIGVYESISKQSFIALDEVEKYGDLIANKLHSLAVIRLSDAEVLYVKDWRKTSLSKTEN